MRRQWSHFLLQQPSPPPFDPQFASIYGPVLAARRERFLGHEHEAWRVFGEWLRAQAATTPEDQRGLARLFDSAMSAGIFFDFDPLTEIILSLAKEDDSCYCLILECDWFSGGPYGNHRFQGHHDTILWRLYISPHLHELEARFSSLFPARDGRKTWEGEYLAGLSKFMTPDDKAAFLTRMGLMMDSLNFTTGWTSCNAAIRAFEVAGVLPDRFVHKVLLRALGCRYFDRTYEVLATLADEATLRTALEDADEEIDDFCGASDGAEMFISFVRVAKAAGFALSKANLEGIASGFESVSMTPEDLAPMVEEFQGYCRQHLSEVECDGVFGLIPPSSLYDEDMPASDAT